MTGPQSLMIMNRSVPSGTHMGHSVETGQLELATPADAVPALRDLLHRRHAVLQRFGAEVLMDTCGRIP
jgi:hypothetical protein